MGNGRADSGGRITIQYTSVVDDALASGIEVFPTVVGTPAPTGGGSKRISNCSITLAARMWRTFLATRVAS